MARLTRDSQSDGESRSPIIDMLLESPDSASPIVTRAVAAGLLDVTQPTYHILPWQRPVLRMLGYLPQSVARYSISKFQSFSGLDPQVLEDISLDRVIRNRLEDYAGIHEQLDTITIGSALGGASAHLALSMHSLFLPLAFVFTLKGGSVEGDARAYFHRSADLALKIADRNPEIITIQHFDPIHDGWLTKYVNHLRVKLVDIPAAYTEFLRRKLKPEGSLCYLDCGAQWLRYRVGERSFFQVGGWGDITAQEFIQGSQRIERYRQDAGLEHQNWQLDGFNLETGAESEWGCEIQLMDALQDFCEHNGYRFVRISLPEPHDYSRLAFQAVARQLQREARQPAGVLVEMFTQFDAPSVVMSGLLPVWLIYNTRDSLEFLREMVSSFPPGKPVFFSPLGTYSLTPDIVPWMEWESLFKGLDMVNIGTRPGHYPADPWTLLGWEKPLWKWVALNRNPILTALDPDDLVQIAGLPGG